MNLNVKNHRGLYFTIKELRKLGIINPYTHDIIVKKRKKKANKRKRRKAKSDRFPVYQKKLEPGVSSFFPGPPTHTSTIQTELAKEQLTKIENENRLIKHANEKSQPNEFSNQNNSFNNDIVEYTPVEFNTPTIEEVDSDNETVHSVPKTRKTLTTQQKLANAHNKKVINRQNNFKKAFVNRFNKIKEKEESDKLILQKAVDEANAKEVAKNEVNKINETKAENKVKIKKAEQYITKQNKILNKMDEMVAKSSDTVQKKIHKMNLRRGDNTFKDNTFNDNTFKEET